MVIPVTDITIPSRSFHNITSKLCCKKDADINPQGPQPGGEG